MTVNFKTHHTHAHTLFFILFVICLKDNVGNFFYGLVHPMKPHRIRMTHDLLVNYDIYKKMEIYVNNKIYIYHQYKKTLYDNIHA